MRLEELLEQAPTNLGTLGMLLNLQAADRDWSGTDQTLMRIREAGANRFVSELAEGNLYQARLQWDKAVASFERAAALNPDAPEPIFALVRIDARQGRLVQAQNRLLNLVAHTPTHKFAHGLLGEILILRGESARAEEEFRQATSIKPDWTTPWVNWVTLKLSQRKENEANEILRHGMLANPTSDELRLLYASHLVDSKHFDEAIVEYETVLKHNPRQLMAANNLASLLADYKGDAKSLDRALTLSRDFEQRAPNPFFLDTLGWVHLKMGHQDDALRVIQLAVAQAPQHPTLNYHLGIAHHKAGHRLDAQAYLQKALESKQPFPGMDEARTALAEVSG
jgi:tetratricopeptide (TPR) repeat protein